MSDLKKSCLAAGLWTVLSSAQASVFTTRGGSLSSGQSYPTLQVEVETDGQEVRRLAEDRSHPNGSPVKALIDEEAPILQVRVPGDPQGCTHAMSRQDGHKGRRARSETGLRVAHAGTGDGRLRRLYEGERCSLDADLNTVDIIAHFDQDGATSEIAEGSKLGIDAMMMAGEGCRRLWPTVIRMDAAVKAKSDQFLNR